MYYNIKNTGRNKKFSDLISKDDIFKMDANISLQERINSGSITISHN
jgi:hypothetical protein